MRSRLSATLALVFAVSTTPALALQRTAARLPLDSGDDWASGWTYTIAYYNYCTGWVWVWSGFAGGDRLGVHTRADRDWDFPRETRILIASGAPAGYGFTGTVAVHHADANGCPSGPALAPQSWLPTGWFSHQVHHWSGSRPRGEWVVLYTFGEAEDNPTGIVTDHPAPGPTGPPACGLCYPTSRECHSFRYGNAATPLCPGSPFFDGTCDAELIVDQGVFLIVAVESKSWGGVKALYR